MCVGRRHVASENHRRVGKCDESSQNVGGSQFCDFPCLFDFADRGYASLEALGAHHSTIR